MSQSDHPTESSDYALDWQAANDWFFDMINSPPPSAPDNEPQNAQNTSLAGFAPELSTPQYALGQYAPAPTPMMMGGATVYPSWQSPIARDPYTEGPSSSAGFASGSSTPQYALGQYAPAPTPTMMGGATAYPSQSPISYEPYTRDSYLQSDGLPLPTLENSWGNSLSPVSDLSSELPTPPPSGSPVDNAWYPVAQNVWGRTMSLQNNYPPGYPLPEQNGLGTRNTTWGVYRHSTVSSSLLNDEEMTVRHMKFGLPTSAAQQHTSKVGMGHYTPYTPQTQSGGIDDASRRAGKGKRKAEDSPEVVDIAEPSRKRARQVFRSICFTPPITCNPVPAPETQRKGHWGGKQPARRGLQFFAHVGSIDSKGTAKTRKAKMEAQYPVNTFQAAFAPTRPGTMPMHRSCGMGLERQPSRATVQAAPIASSGAGSSRKVATSRRL